MAIPTNEQVKLNILHNTESQEQIDFNSPIMQFSQDKWKTEWVEKHASKPVETKVIVLGSKPLPKPSQAVIETILQPTLSAKTFLANR